MSTRGAVLDPPHALAAVGLPEPGGDPGVLRDNAQAHYALAAQLRAHSAHIEDLVRQSQTAWQGSAADAFRLGAASHANDLATTASIAVKTAEQHEDHASRLEQALEILKELAIQIAATLAFITAAALFPPLLAAAEMHLAALAVDAGRLVQWLADLLAAVVRFFVRARTWIAQVSKLVWRSESASLGYGKVLYDGARDITVDVLASLTARGVGHKPFDITMVWSALGSGLAGGLIGGLEASGFKKVLTAGGEVKRAADGLPEFVSMGEQAKSWVKSLGRGPSHDGAGFGQADALGTSATATAAGTPDNAVSRTASDLEDLTRVASHDGAGHATGVSEGGVIRSGPGTADRPATDVSVPAPEEIAQALGGAGETVPYGGVRFAEVPVDKPVGGRGNAPAVPGPTGSLDRFLAARAGTRKAGLRGVPGEGAPLARQAEAAGAAQRSATALHQQAEMTLRTAQERLRAAEQLTAARTEALGRSRAQVWAAESRHDLAQVFGDPARVQRAAQEVARARTRESLGRRQWERATGARAAADAQVRAASRATDVAAAEAAAARQRLDAALARHQAWQGFADAGRALREETSASSLFAGALRRNTWKEGLPVEYGQAVRNGERQLRPMEWQKAAIGGFSPQSLKAIEAPKSWREALLYEPTKGFFKGSLGNTVSTGIAYRPGQTNPLVWVGVPIAGVGNVTRDLLKGVSVNRLFPDKSIEDALFRVGTKSLGKQVIRMVMGEIVPSPARS
ncbi:WXG100 family type VII secretion target [Kitasatospora sp. NPDC059571]|uniref:WXG100 family type VII secretion target n=1 Tax=Kitasatospora sp. NPDC059571 TaxID=3346871 RepID=UPI003688D9EF